MFHLRPSLQPHSLIPSGQVARLKGAFAKEFWEPAFKTGRAEPTNLFENHRPYLGLAAVRGNRALLGKEDSSITAHPGPPASDPPHLDELVLLETLGLGLSGPGLSPSSRANGGEG